MRILRLVLLSILGIGVAIAQTAPAPFPNCERIAPVVIRPIGHPIWKPVDFHVFTAGDTGAMFHQNMINLLYPLRHQWCGDIVGIGPGDPHQPPYLKEMEAGLDIMNFKESAVFHVSDFSPPNGVWAAWMVVPNPGTTGSSPDFSSGPIIPNALFPIHVVGKTYRNGLLWDQYLGTFDVPVTQNLGTCYFNVDGHSHFPVIYAEDSSYGPGGPIPGNYQFRVTMTDVNGDGWSITVVFMVVK